MEREDFGHLWTFHDELDLFLDLTTELRGSFFDRVRHGRFPPAGRYCDVGMVARHLDAVNSKDLGTTSHHGALLRVLQTAVMF